MKHKVSDGESKGIVHRVTCAVCGKPGTVEIDEDTRVIVGEFIYFGNLLIQGKRVDYWECKECCDKDE